MYDAADDIASGTMADALHQQATWVKVEVGDASRGDLWQSAVAPHVYLWVRDLHDYTSRCRSLVT